MSAATQSKPQASFLRPREVEECNIEQSKLQSLLDRPDPEGRIKKGAVRQAMARNAKRLEQAPPDLTPDQRTKNQKRIEELETQLKEGLLSHEEMRRNPPGAVDQNMRWHKRNKHAVQEWKNRLLMQHKGIPADEANDMLNVDRLRPWTSRLNMDGAQIPKTTSFYEVRYDSPHPAAASYEDIFGDPKESAAQRNAKQLEEERNALLRELQATQDENRELRNKTSKAGAPAR